MKWPTWLVLIVAAEALLAALLETRFRLHGGIPWDVYYLVFVEVTLAVGLLVFLAWLAILFRSGVERPTAHMLGRLKKTSAEQWGAQFVPLIALPAFMASHTTFKAVLPHLTSYWADAPLADFDRLLFFGHDAWEVTHAVFGASATLWIDRIYYLWFPVTFLMLFAVLFVPRLAQYRGQVLLTYIVAWIVLGAVLAVAVASVGPCFYSEVHGDPRYAELMAKLSEQPLNATRAQAKLLGDHANNTIGFGSGLSAMPSMHISVATISALLLRRLGWAWLGYLWLATIFIGSIHLGWHYASDGIIAAPVTLVIWKLFRPRKMTSVADVPAALCSRTG